MSDPAAEFEELTLSAGGLHFSALAAGPADGEPVLLVHGFPDTYRTWAPQLRALQDAGYRAVAPMLRGYEPASQTGRSVSSYHPIHVAEDVLALSAELGAGRKVHLVGHDWGSIAVQLAVRLEPERFVSVTLVAVPPMGEVVGALRRTPGQLVNSSYMLLFQFRGLAERIVAHNDFAFLEALWRRWSPGWQWNPEDMAALKETFRRPGVLVAALSYYRAMAATRSEESARTRTLIGKRWNVPVLVITGASDRCIDTRLFDGIDPGRFEAGLRVERLGGGHFVHQEEPEATNRLLLDRLRGGGV